MARAGQRNGPDLGPEEDREEDLRVWIVTDGKGWQRECLDLFEVFEIVEARHGGKLHWVAQPWAPFDWHAMTTEWRVDPWGDEDTESVYLARPWIREASGRLVPSDF